MLQTKEETLTTFRNELLSDGFTQTYALAMIKRMCFHAADLNQFIVLFLNQVRRSAGTIHIRLTKIGMSLFSEQSLLIPFQDCSIALLETLAQLSQMKHQPSTSSGYISPYFETILFTDKLTTIHKFKFNSVISAKQIARKIFKCVIDFIKTCVPQHIFHDLLNEYSEIVHKWSD